MFCYLVRIENHIYLSPKSRAIANFMLTNVLFYAIQSCHKLVLPPKKNPLDPYYGRIVGYLITKHQMR